MTLRCKHHWRVSRVRESIKLGFWRATLYSSNQSAPANPATYVHTAMARKSQVPSAYYGKLLLKAWSTVAYMYSSLCGVRFSPHGQLVTLIFNGRCDAGVFIPSCNRWELKFKMYLGYICIQTWTKILPLGITAWFINVSNNCDMRD